MKNQKNTKLWNHLINELNDFEIKAGWFENSTYDGKTPVFYIAAIQNYGCSITVTEKQRKFLHYLGVHLKQSTKNIIIPARPFMDNARARVEGQEGKEILMQEMLRVFEGRQTMQQAVVKLGEWVKGIITEEITKINSPALSQITVTLREKSSSARSLTKPLNNTMHMIDTLSYKYNLKRI